MEVHGSLRNEAVTSRDRFGGAEGNEILTSAIAVVLTGLLVAEGVTIVHMRGLVSTHMFVGMVLVPPVLLKLASAGYRFLRYYTGSRALAGLDDHQGVGAVLIGDGTTTVPILSSGFLSRFGTPVRLTL
jgi:hypothetical protein